MSLQRLLASAKLKPHATSRQELDELRGVVARDLSDAASLSISADRRFATAYNAALQTATMAIACAGYRTSGSDHHKSTLDAAALVLGQSSATTIAYFNRCRRMRNTLDYNRAHVATETEAQQILQEAQRFLQFVEDWIAQNYPNLKP